MTTSNKAPNSCDCPPHEDKGATRNVTHKPKENPNRAERKLEETKRALHEFEEQKGDWAKSR